jgi:hypothetical protein
MPLDEAQRSQEIQRRTTSLRSSSESLANYLTNLLPTLVSSPLCQYQAAATLELVSLMTLALSALQYAARRSSSTGDFTELQNWKLHWRTACENFETQYNINLMPELFDN